ncbi:hypothetical protein TNCV_4439341 [Trichonephila clavipes]|nr:hypothetical protein TNCV_4439341 [Trichonephila clavipes]
MVAIIQQLCGMTCDFIVGPYFFETTTVSGPKLCNATGTSYGAMWREQLIPALQERYYLETMIFMLVGATPHIANPVKNCYKIPLVWTET